MYLQNSVWTTNEKLFFVMTAKLGKHQANLHYIIFTTISFSKEVPSVPELLTPTLLRL